MFLNQIESEELKKSFLELTHYVAAVDGQISAKEQEFLDQYLFEMELEQFTPSNIPLADIVKGIDDPIIQNIFFVEILALIFVDGQYNEEEKQVVREIRETFGYSEEKYEAFKSWVLRMNSLQKEGFQLVYAG